MFTHAYDSTVWVMKVGVNLGQEGDVAHAEMMKCQMYISR